MLGNVVNATFPANIPIENKGSGERGECGECFSNAYACARARACEIEDPEKRSPRSPHSPNPTKIQKVTVRERGGECLDRTFPDPQSARLAEGGAVMRTLPQRAPDRQPRCAVSLPQSRTTTASSAKNHAVAALTTTAPLNGDHHGFDDSDSACRHGKPRGGSRTILALDLGNHHRLGAALGGRRASTAARCRSARAATTAAAFATCASAPGSTAWRRTQPASASSITKKCAGISAPTPRTSMAVCSPR